MGGVCTASKKKSKQPQVAQINQGLPPSDPQPQQIFQVPQHEPIEKPKQSHPIPSNYPKFFLKITFYRWI